MDIKNLLTLHEAAALAGASLDSIKHAVYRAKTLTRVHTIDRKPLLSHRDVVRWSETPRKPGPKASAKAPAKPRTHKPAST